MADWSELPSALIEEIFTRLDSPIDILRFRSVCSAWRQSTSSLTTYNNHHQFPFSLPFRGISLFKRSIFHLSPSETSIVESPENPNSWVIKIEEKNPNFFNLYFPLSCTQITPLPISFPRVLDLSNIRIRELGHEYFLCCSDEVSFRGNLLNMLLENVAFLSGKNGDYSFLTIHISGGLALYNSVDGKWCFISGDLDVTYGDVIAFNGEFYAADHNGLTVLIGLDTDDSVSLVANPVCGGDQKRLVEMGGELMLVDVYMALPPCEDDKNLEYLDDYLSSSSRSMWFKVYRLDREGKNWVEVKDLGNYILFLSMASAFSASAEDFPNYKGNCIYFNFPEIRQPSCFHEDDGVFKFHCGGVYNLEDARITFSNLFWPPPPWITSSSLEENPRA